MKCQVRDCLNEATQVRDIPNLGESLCFCDLCVALEIKKYNEDFGWYILTFERSKEEEQNGFLSQTNMIGMSKALKNYWGKK